jgi:crossover junction endodeoxyribonuclease RuvC
MKMSKFFMGIDPGATGAAAFINEEGVFLCFLDYPGSAAGLVAELSDLLPAIPLDLNQNQIVLAVLEEVHPMPKQGISSTGKFMRNLGQWEGVLAAKKIPYEMITPQRWRRVLDSSVPKKPTKDDLRAYAIKRWPAAAESLNRVKDHNRAEALIMAEYARLKHLGQAK